MPQKADKKDLTDLENKLLNKLHDLIQEMLGKFADKDETDRRIKKCAAKIKELFDLVGKNKHHEDDAMFTRKPYGPVNCASCDKDIINLIGRPVDYHAWKVLPFKEPGERVARYGQGFSRILHNM